jgi:hypothetical protein
MSALCSPTEAISAKPQHAAMDSCVRAACLVSSYPPQGADGIPSEALIVATPITDPAIFPTHVVEPDGQGRPIST